MHFDPAGVTFIASVIGIFYTLWKIVSLVIDCGKRLGELELKVNTMWAFQMRRALSEVVDKEIGVANSPVVFHEEVRQTLDPMKPRLVEWWQKVAVTLRNDAEILLEIEKQFGQELIENVCLPKKLTHGACLLLAYSVAKQTTQIDFVV